MVEDEGEQDFVDVQRERGEVCEAGEGLAEGCEEGDWGEEGIEHFFRGGFWFLDEEGRRGGAVWREWRWRWERFMEVPWWRMLCGCSAGCPTR